MVNPLNKYKQKNPLSKYSKQNPLMQYSKEKKKSSLEKYKKGSIQKPPTGMEAVGDKFATWLQSYKFNKKSIPPLEIGKRILFKKEEDPQTELIRQGISNYINTAAFNLPEYLAKKVGVKRPKPKTSGQRIAAGLGQLGGFITGPVKAAGKIAPKIPVLGRAFKPATTMTQAIGKPILRGATTLGTAEGLITPTGGFTKWKERGKRALGGAQTGAAFGGISFIPNKALRMVTSSAYIGVPSTLRNEPLEEQVYKYGLGAWFGREGGTPKQILKKEKSVVEAIRNGLKTNKYLKENKETLNLEKELSFRTGEKPLSRKKRFEKVANKRGVSSLLNEAQKVFTNRLGKKQQKKFRRGVVAGIKKRIKEIRKNPKYWFDLSHNNVDFLMDYIRKDLDNKSSNLKKLDNVTLQSIYYQLKDYSPPKVKDIFHARPPLKNIFAGRSWKKKISPWDVTLRPALHKLKKLGFGWITDKGLTAQFFNSAVKKSQFQNRYIRLRNNWLKTVGTNKKRARDIFNYLNGDTHGNYIKKMHGEKVLNTAKQMRTYLDTLLRLQNRHRAKYGEDPIKARKNYITHIFDKTIQEIQTKKYPFPDYLSSVMKYIKPKKKSSPYLKKRKRGGAKGYVKNIWRALDAYTMRTSQIIGDDPIRNAYRIHQGLRKQMKREQKTGNVSKINWSGIDKSLMRYVESLQGRPGTIDKALRGAIDPLNSILARLPGGPQIKSLNDLSNGMITLLYGTQMGYRPKLPLRNLGQHSLIIGQTGFKSLAKAIGLRQSKKAKKILKHSKVLKSRKRAFGAETQAIFGKGAIKKGVELGLRPFRAADRINVSDAFLAGYYQAKAKGKTNKQAYKRGDNVASLTQYLYLPENRSDLARGWRLSKTLGRPLSVFTTWPANWVEFNIASASNKETRKNLMKYWATALTLTAVTAPLGIKGAEYVGITSPSSLLQMLKGKLPIAGIAETPDIQVLKELRDILDGDKDLKDIFFYTFRD